MNTVIQFRKQTTLSTRVGGGGDELEKSRASRPALAPAQPPKRPWFRKLGGVDDPIFPMQQPPPKPGAPATDSSKPKSTLFFVAIGVAAIAAVVVVAKVIL